MLLLNFVATPLYLSFAVFLYQGKVANTKLLFTFVTARNRLFFVTVLGIKKSLKIQKMLHFFVMLSDDVTQLSLFQKFFI